MRTWTRAHPLWAFLGLTFLVSWAVWVPMALDHYGLWPVKMDPNVVLVVRLLGTLGPALAAVIVSALRGGRVGVQALFGQFRRGGIRAGWLAAGGLALPSLVLVSAGLYSTMPGAGPLPWQPFNPVNLAINAIILTCSVLGEEIGWRGLALPELLRRQSGLRASLVLGTIHTLWHLPFWTILGELERFGAGYWLLNWVYILALTIFITWLWNRTGSLWMPVLCHWSLNLFTVGLLPLTTVTPAYLIYAGLVWVLALGLLRLEGRELRAAIRPV